MPLSTLQVIFSLLCIMILYIARQLIKFREDGLAVHGPDAAADEETLVNDHDVSEEDRHSD